MIKRLYYFLYVIALTLIINDVKAAVPVITYAGPQVYTTGTAITTLTPSVTNGVSAIGFGGAVSLTGATLSNPRGIGIDGSGNVYVANMGNNTISKYGPTGAYIGTFGSGATMSSPDYIVFDSSSNAYVLNLTTGTVFKYNSSGVYQSTIISGLSYALGMTIDASNNIYIADQGANAVKEYNTAGTVLLTLPSANFNTPLGVAVDASGNIYVLNNGANNVTKYNSAGTFQSTFLSGFSNSQSIVIDGAGNFYIGDNAATNTVYVYNASGTLLTSKAINNPEGIAVDSKGDIFSSARYSNTMSENTPTGGFYLNKALPAGLTFNSSTGAISGTSTVAMATTVYTITAYNASGSGSTTLSITVNPTVPTGSGGSACSSGAIALSASGSTPAGGVYNWYAALSGGSSLATGSTYTTPVITATTTYYVDYTLNGATSTPRTAVTATVNAKPVLAIAPTSPTGSLYLSYPFTGNANDVSGNSNNGTLQNAPSLTTDRYGAANSAYSFNGTSQYVSTATSVASPGPQNFSISVWFKTSSAGGKLVGFGNLQTGSSANYDRQLFMGNSGQIYFGLYMSNSLKTINTAASYADGSWHHAVATESTTNGANLYVDGALQATDGTLTNSQSYAGYWRIGYDNMAFWGSAPTNYYFNGSLDDVAIYNTVLTASQVYTLYGGGSTPVCVGGTLSLQANTVAGATYSWSGPNGYTSTSQNPTVSSAATAAMAGTYTCTVTGSNGCTSAINVVAVVNALPSATFAATSTVSVNSPAIITYTGTDPSTSTYSWDFNGGTPSTGTGQGPFSVAWATTGTKTITLTITNANGCSSSSTQSVVVNNAAYGNYAFGDLVTLNTTSLGITSNLTNFPVLLSIQDNNLIISGTCADKVQNPNGPNYDFAFVSGGSELYYQIESYNQVTGTLLVWVQIPTLTFATNNAITLYYGSTSPTVSHNTAFFQNTWASDYLAVYHFNEASYTGSVTDGTAGGRTGTTSGMTSADLVTGKIGTAYSFNGSGKKITASAASVTGPFTISAWVKLGVTGTDEKVITNQTSSGSLSGGYKLGVFTTNIPETESGTGSNRSTTPNPTAFASGVWHYIQGVYTGTTLSTYVDGVQYKVLAFTTNPTAYANLYIGTEGGGGSPYFNGTIDEPRVSNVAKTADWIKAEYGDQNNPTAFTTVSATTINTTNAAAIPGAFTYTWTGATSTDPAVAGNWNNTTAGTTNQLPAFNGTATLVIPSGLTNYPSLTANASLYGLTIASGASLNLNGHTLSVACNIYNSSTGQILYGANNASGITWNGASAAQTYTGANTANTLSVGQMTVNNSASGTVTINGGPVDIYKSLTMTNGSLVISASPAALTLKSTATVSASVSALPAGSTITGSVNVERFLTGGAGYRGYRLLSSPVYGSVVSSNNVYSINYIKNNSYITGTTGIPGGFDKAGNPTIYLFRENIAPSNNTFLSGNYRGVNTIGTAPNYSYLIDGDAGSFNLPVGNGFLFFFRGDRSAGTLATETTTTYVPTNTTITASGTLNTGQIIVNNWYTPASPYLGWTNGTANSAVRGFNMVGNPYASSIDWETYNTTTSTSGIYANNVGTIIYELNPFTKNFDIYQKGGVHTNNGSNIIASGQGFFVFAVNNTNPQLIFNESAKTTTQNTGLNLFMSTKADITALDNTGGDQHLRLQLVKDSVNKDDIYIGFSSSAKAQYVYNEDAPYKIGTGPESLASISGDNIALGINRLPLPKQSETIGLKVEAATDGIYRLNMTELKAIPELFDIWLMDAYKKDSLDMRHNTTYAFNLYKADTNSFGSHRFSLVIRQNPALAFHLLDFSVAKTTDGSRLTWKAENEENYTHFTVERSTDNGITFDVLGGVSSDAGGNYSFLDTKPLTGINQYRLKQEDINGAISYSKIVPLMYSGLSNYIVGNLVSVYPNPAGSTINLSITQTAAESPYTSALYNISIMNGNGAILKTTNSAQALSQENVSSLMPGPYIIQVLNNKDNTVVGKVKFVKL